MGSDPGMGVLYAAAAAGVALGARYAYDKYQEYQAGKTLPTAVSLTIDVVGKIWNIPNTVLGLAYGGVGHVAGWFMGTDPQIQFGHNGIEFLDNPVMLKDGALTLGNAISYNKEKPPWKPGTYGDDAVPYGLHEEAHTYQSQVLGLAFIPNYLLNSRAFEQAAQSYGKGPEHGGHWWPWRW